MKGGDGLKVIRIAPRGYCYGVVDAMVIASRAAAQPELPRPIYILGMIVHNQYVVDAFARQDIITLDGGDRASLLEEIDHGTVIFTAHGISPEVRAKASAKGLTVLDATCPDVTRTHDLIRGKVAAGYEVVYIGKRGHPEPEGAVGVAPHAVHLVEHPADVALLPETVGLGRDGAGPRQLIVTNQTTMSQWDTRDLVAAVVARFPGAEVHNEICDATQVRQDAVARQARDADLCIVVGDPRSNNSARLAQVAQEIAGVPAFRVAHAGEIDPQWLRGAETVAVTAGASTPTPVTRAVISFLEAFDPENPETWLAYATVDYDHLLPTAPRNGDQGARNDANESGR